MSQSAATCIVCGKSLRSRFIRTSAGEFLCPSHTNTDVCTACGSYAGVRTREHIGLCVSCDGARVTTSSDIESARLHALSWYSRQIGHHGLDRVPVQVGLLSESAVRAGNLGYAKCSSLGHDGLAEIYVAEGLHKIQLAMILVHEFTHVLLFMNTLTAQVHAIDQLDLISEEGTCQLAAFLFLQSQTSAQAQHLMKCIERDTSPVYGDGFRMMREELKSFTGLHQLLSSLTGGQFRPDPATTMASRRLDEVSRAIEEVAERHRPTLLIPAAQVPANRPLGPNTNQPQSRPIIRLPRVPMHGNNNQPTVAGIPNPKPKRPTIFLG